MKVIAVIGRSGAGKTTFLCRLIAALRRLGRSSAVIKHCGSGFDLGGKDKDSNMFLRAGAEAVTLSGPKGTAVVRRPRSRPKDRALAAVHAGVDFVFIEGGRTEPGIPTIEVVGLDPGNRASIRKADRRIIVARCPVSSAGPVFSPGNVREIAAFILAGPAEDEAFFGAHDPVVHETLKKAVVAVAGAGGLGSNVAMALARCGVGTLLLADFDRVEPSNLNRQQYFTDQVGRSKVEALSENITRIPSGTMVVARMARINADNVGRLFGRADVLVEAFDRADQKQMLIEAWMTRFPDRPVVAASGLAGYGANNRIRERRIGLLTLIGDEESEPPAGISPMAPRVAAVAAMQANRVIEILMKARKTPC
ncbi:MAG: sulfur carrier protein ThiS adenylyltransferase ThiF [Candidatus Aminicenantes bacterium]|nr:sulfur carrier protein ThiS adenylyltransferase ThiF [Candidatus Aminicenantes bacterium]